MINTEKVDIEERETQITMSDIQAFDPNIPKEEVDRLFRKLKDTRLPEIPVVPDAGDDYGTSTLSVFSSEKARVRCFTDSLTNSRSFAGVDQQAEKSLARRIFLVRCAEEDLGMASLHHLGRGLEGPLYPRESKDEAV